MSVFMDASVLFWDGKIKCRAAIYHAFRPCPAAVAANDAQDIGQANARALELFLTVQALKHAEQLVSILGIKTRAIVANRDDRLAVDARSALDFDFGQRPPSGKLHSIGDQIDKNETQQGTIRSHRWQWADFPRNVSPLQIRLKFAHDLPNQLVKINICLLQFSLPDVRE